MARSTTIIVSPHCDDAAFSLGGCLANRSFGDVEVINVFTVTDYTAQGRGEIEAVTALRKQEDAVALGPLVEDISWLDFRDATLRGLRGGPGFFRKLARRWDSITQHAVFKALSAKIAERGASLLLFPAGYGGHRDHVIATRIGLMLAEQGYPVLHYLDMPYGAAVTRPEDLPRPSQSHFENARVLRCGDKTGKEALLTSYMSQQNTEQQVAIMDHFRRVGGEFLFASRPMKGLLASIVGNSRRAMWP